ncbi:hypothetical protein K474DRAFT_1655677 [Panus rudis PR-1116 ss-1]|nr:hypothetical protein K474DRAFT_1655677 [Panus rudis PR-1116 ss-1]
MSDPRFARLKTDPRFRPIRKKESKVVVDDRFKSIFDAGKKQKKQAKGRVDKYGRPLTETHEADNLRRYYRLENEDQEEDAEPRRPDYARGEVLLESSDEEQEDDAALSSGENDSAEEGVVTLGRDASKPIPVPEDEVEIDLDEDNFADLDAQAEEYSKAHADDANIEPTRRIAVVNLDWDHVRAIHLYKIFSSLVSPSAPAVAASSDPQSNKTGNAPRVIRGKVLSVRVYPSQFGKERMAREEREGPPPELFKRRMDDDEEINEKNIYETGGGEDYDEDALRRYQLERLRYYYAIVECDTVEAASHIFNELEGTELERSANVFDLSFVPNDMTFDDEPRDEATDDLNVPFKPLDFTTDALRHSRVKLTWDEDDPDRVQITRRQLSRKELDENDFKAYLASSSSGSDSEGEDGPSTKASRDKLRALLLSGNGDNLPEGWVGEKEDGVDVDMEVTFTPGLSGAKEDKDETTLEKYQRKMKEKKKKRKEEIKEKRAQTEGQKEKPTAPKDDFFSAGSEDEDSGSEASDEGLPQKNKGKGKGRRASTEPGTRSVSTAEELALVAAPDRPDDEPKHFNMKAIIKAEKLKGKKLKGKRKRQAEQENELQEDFAIDVKDERFKAVLEDPTFAIDPSNPHFKKTKSMAALLEERSKRQRERPPHQAQSSRANESGAQPSLQSLVESVKRKSAATDTQGSGKRRKH